MRVCQARTDRSGQLGRLAYQPSPTAKVAPRLPLNPDGGLGWSWVPGVLVHVQGALRAPACATPGQATTIRQRAPPPNLASLRHNSPHPGARAHPSSLFCCHQMPPAGRKAPQTASSRPPQRWDPDRRSLEAPLAPRRGRRWRGRHRAPSPLPGRHQPARCACNPPPPRRRNHRRRRSAHRPIAAPD